MTQYSQEVYVPQTRNLSRQSTDAIDFGTIGSLQNASRQSTEAYEECASDAENSGSCFSDQMIYSDSLVYDEKSNDNVYNVLNYKARIFRPTCRRTIHFPKSVLTTNVPKIREFKEPQKHLYYYLTWSCKMALIDQGFVHFTFSDCNVADIGIFNTELHDKRTNATLYVVAKFTQIPSNAKSRKGQPLWTMDRMMTARQLCKKYGISEYDLPNGSRAKRNSFSGQITMHYQRLSSRIVKVNDWKKIPILPNKKSFNPEDVDGVDLNEAIRHSIEQIKDEEDELELIPILTIRPEHVYCDVLIPIQVNDGKWFAVSYKTSTIRPYKATVTGLYVDAEDILCKASLVDANAVTAYDYIIPPAEEAVSVPVTPMKRLKLTNHDSNDSVSSEIMETVNSQSIQLKEALGREQILIQMMLNQSNIGSRSVQSITSNSSFMSLPPVSPSPSMSFAQRTPSINQMHPSRSAPMLPSLIGSIIPSPLPTPMATPPPQSLGNSFSLGSCPSSPSFGPVTNLPNIHKVMNDIMKFRGH